jgi:hypothetical protein
VVDARKRDLSPSMSGPRLCPVRTGLVRFEMRKVGRWKFELQRQFGYSWGRIKV